MEGRIGADRIGADWEGWFVLEAVNTVVTGRRWGLAHACFAHTGWAQERCCVRFAGARNAFHMAAGRLGVVPSSNPDI